MERAKRLLFIGSETSVGREVIKGVDSYCRTHGRWEYHLEGGCNPMSRMRASAAIVQWKADGIIGYFSTLEMERLARSSGLPVVNFDGSRTINLPTVISDPAAVARMVAQHFCDNGFRNFAFFSRCPELHIHKRCDAFVGELARMGFNAEVFVDQCVDKTRMTWFKDYRRIGRWLTSLKKPVAIMCCYDYRAQDVLTTCRRLGLRVPDDVAVVGSGNQETLCHICTPPLSSVDPDAQRIGYEAARLLHRLLSGNKPPSAPIVIAPRRLVTRQSSDVIAVDDPDVANAMRWIRNHADEPISVKDILRHVPICRKTLEVRFEKLIGRTPKDEIVRVRLDRATNLVRATELPIKTVARNLGFCNPRKFTAFFHRKTGLTPTQYRRDCSGNAGVDNGKEARIG